MHELGIAQDFWKIILHNANENRLRAVTKIVLVVGEASGIETDFLRHSLQDHILPGTLAEKAELVFIAEKLKARCNRCGSEILPSAVTALACPSCESADIEIIAGRDTYVQSIEGE